MACSIEKSLKRSLFTSCGQYGDFPNIKIFYLLYNYITKGEILIREPQGITS